MNGFVVGGWLHHRGAGCLGAVDWAAWGLWATASLVAVSLLGVAMNRRRQGLTETLREHVSNTIGPPTGGAGAVGEADGEADSEADSEAVGDDPPS